MDNIFHAVKYLLEMAQGRFIIKRVMNLKPQKRVLKNVAQKADKAKPLPPKEVKKTMKNKQSEKQQAVMTTSEKIEMANEILNGEAQVKKIKRDKGLIERAESAKTILTEDNKELLKD